MTCSTTLYYTAERYPLGQLMSLQFAKGLNFDSVMTTFQTGWCHLVTVAQNNIGTKTGPLGSFDHILYIL